MHEGKIVTYPLNGHKYLIDRDITSQEAKLVEDRMQVLHRIGNKRDKLLAEQQMVEGMESAEELIRYGEITIEISELDDESAKVQAELNPMLREALHNCYNLAVADIDKIDYNEQIWIFLKLVMLCK